MSAVKMSLHHLEPHLTHVCKWGPALIILAVLCSEQCDLRGIIVFFGMKIRPKLAGYLSVKL